MIDNETEERVKEAFRRIIACSRVLRAGGPAPEDLQKLSDALDDATNIASDALELFPELGEREAEPHTPRRVPVSADELQGD